MGRHTDRHTQKDTGSILKQFFFLFLIDAEKTTIFLIRDVAAAATETEVGLTERVCECPMTHIHTLGQRWGGRAVCASEWQ